MAPSAQRRKVWMTPTTRVTCNNAANIGERKTWTQSDYFAPGKIPLRGKSPRKCTYSVPAQETAKHCAKFGWFPLSDVDAVTKSRRKTPWNLLGCCKLTNRSQPLVGRSSPYCEKMLGRCCCLTTFSDCRYVPYLQRYIPTKLYFQRAACSTFQTCILNS